MADKNNAKLPLLIEGSCLNPKTGLPFKFEVHKELKQNIIRILRIKDEQNAINRYVWDGLPLNISSQDLERFLYLKGQLAMFYYKEIDTYYIMPYALNGGIDFYGRFKTIHPVPMASGQEGSDRKIQSHIDKQRNLLSTLSLDVIYDEDEITEEIDSDKCCVLLHDYSKGLSENIIPRSYIQEPIIESMSDCIPYMRTALRNSTGITAMRVGNEDEKSNVLAANDSMELAAQQGWKLIPVLATLQLQEIMGGNVAKGEEFMQAMQSLDNFRLSLYGISNGGVFEKKAHMLGSEQEMNEQQSNDILEDGLKIRQRFCDICNKLWGVNMSVQINPNMNEDNAQMPMTESDQEEGEDNESME